MSRDDVTVKEDGSNSVGIGGGLRKAKLGVRSVEVTET